jgi:hypothetical protein
MISNIQNPAEFLAAMREIETRDEAEPHTVPNENSIDTIAENCDYLLLSSVLAGIAKQTAHGSLRTILLITSKVVRDQNELVSRLLSVIAQDEQLQSIQRGERSC